MTDRKDCYTLLEAADLLSLSYDAIRMKINRGTLPAIRCRGRMVGIPKRGFWEACAQLEQVGQIRESVMSPKYRTERLLFLGEVSYEQNVLYGKKGARR